MNKLVLETVNLEQPETKLVISFLEWFEVNVEVLKNVEVIRYTEGKEIPILMIDNIIVAKGFFDIVLYIKSYYNQNQGKISLEV